MSGELSFISGIDNAKLKMDAREASNLIQGIGSTAETESAKMENSFSGAGKAFALIGGGAAITMLGKEILDTTAKFEKFGIVLRNTLGNSAGNDALDMIAQFAATTPFQLDEVTAAFIKMSNQGFTPTRDEMVKLGDLASTTGKSFDQLTEALLDAQTGQFERLKEFGIKASVTGDKVTFSFREQMTTVENTNSAIQKYMLSLGDLKGVAGSNALISASLTGELSNLEDKLAMMYNTIGTGNKGVLYEGVGMVTSLIDNYEEVGKVILSLVAIYGSYKAAVMVVNAVTAIQKEIAIQQMLANIGNTGATISLTAAEGVEAVVTSQLTRAQLALNASMLANPYVLATVAVVALSVGVYALATHLDAAQKAHEKLNDTSSKMETSIRGEVIQVDTLFARLKAAKKGTDEYKTAKDAIMSQYGQYLKGLGSEATALNNVALAQKTITDAIIATARARAMTTATADAAGDLATSQGNVTEKVKKIIDAKFGVDSKQSLELLAQIKVVIQNGGTVREDFLKKFDDVKYIQNGQFGGTTEYVDNELKNLLSKAKEAKKLFDDINKTAELKFGSATTQAVVKPKGDVSKTPAQIKAEEAAARKAETARAKEEKRLQNEADATLKLATKTADAELAKRQAVLTNQQALDNLLEEGFAKKTALIDDDHKQELLNIDKRAQELLAKQQETEKLAWEKNGKKGVFTPTTKTTSQLSATDLNEITTSKTTAQLKFAFDTKTLLNSLVDTYQSFDEKRKAIDEKYNDDVTALRKAKLVEGADVPKLDASIKVATQYNTEDNAALDKQIAEKEILFKGFVSRITVLGLAEIEKLLAQAQTSLSLTTGTSDEKAVLRAKIAEMQEQIKSLKTNGGKDTEADVITNAGLTKAKNTVTVLQNVGSEINNVISGFDGMDEGTKAALQAASNITMAVLSSISGIIALSAVGEETIKGVERASVILAIIGAAIAVVTTIIGLFTSAAAKRRKEEAEIEAQRKEYLGIIDLNEELRKKYEWTQKIGESTLDYIKRQGEELAKQTSANAVDQEALMAKLQQQTYVSGTKRDYNWFGGYKNVDVSSSLAGKTYEEIETLAAEGKLSKEGNDYFEALKKAKEEGVDLVKQSAEYLESIKELVTGTTSSSIVDSIIEGFKAGKRSAADFADTFESLMQGAVQSALKQLTDTRVREWYVKFAAMSEDGLTAEEKATLQASWNKIIADTATDAANLEAATGVSITDTEAREASTKGFASMSQDSSDELNGRFTAMQGLMYNVVEGQKIIQGTTGSILENVIEIKGYTSNLIDMKSDMASIKQGIIDINTKGILIKI